MALATSPLAHGDKLNNVCHFIVCWVRSPVLGSAEEHRMPEQMMKQSHSRLLQWSTQLSPKPYGRTTRPKNCSRGSMDHEAIGLFHALIPALLASLLLWSLLPLF